MMSNWGHEAKMVDIIEAQNYAALFSAGPRHTVLSMRIQKQGHACGRCPGLLG